MWGLFTIKRNGSVYLYLLGFYQMSKKLCIYLVYLLICMTVSNINILFCHDNSRRNVFKQIVKISLNCFNFTSHSPLLFHFQCSFYGGVSKIDLGKSKVRPKCSVFSILSFF